MLCASELIFLAGSKYLPVTEIGDQRLAADVQEFKRGPERLAVAVVCAALLALRDEGAVSITASSRKALGFVPVHSLNVAATGSTTAPARSFEHRLSAHLDDKPRGVDYPIARSVPITKNAWDATLSTPLGGLLEAGVLYRTEPATVPADTRKRRANPPAPIVVRVEEVQSRLPDLQAWIERWHEFHRTEPELEAQLGKRVHSAIMARNERDDDDD